MSSRSFLSIRARSRCPLSPRSSEILARTHSALGKPSRITPSTRSTSSVSAIPFSSFAGGASLVEWNLPVRVLVASVSFFEIGAGTCVRCPVVPVPASAPDLGLVLFGIRNLKVDPGVTGHAGSLPPSGDRSGPDVTSDHRFGKMSTSLVSVEVDVHCIVWADKETGVVFGGR